MIFLTLVCIGVGGMVYLLARGMRPATRVVMAAAAAFVPLIALLLWLLVVGDQPPPDSIPYRPAP